MSSCKGKRVRLQVDGQEIPTVEQGVRTELSSDSQRSGAGITRLTEAHIPYEFRGTNYVDQISAFDPANQSEYSTAEVEFQSVRNPSEWTTVQRGFVRGVSGVNDTGTGGASSGVGKLYISDPSELLTAMSFSARYDKPSVEKIFNDVVQTFNENSVFNAQVSNVPERSLGGQTDGAIEGILSGLTVGTPFEGVANEITDSKAFKNNRHSCAQALTWTTDVSNHRWYFDTDSGGQLSLVYDDGSQSAQFSQRENRGAAQDQQLRDQGSFPQCGPTELDVIRNDALASIFPINTLSVKGVSGSSVLGFNVQELGGSKFPYVTVSYTPFKESAGGNVVGETITANTNSIETTKKKAKKELEQRILSAGNGEIECFGNGHPKPYDSVSAKPECSDILTQTAPELSYTISGVIHEKAATKEHGPLESRTTLKVAPAFNPDEISVETAEMREQ